jgi:superoxide dismutase, Fe-Mn family
MKKFLFVSLIFCPFFLFADMMEEVHQQHYPFSLPSLPYSFNSLEPYIDSKTVEIHYGRHHKAYVDNFNKAIANTPWEKASFQELFANASKLPLKIKNNAGGHWNHSFYWYCLRPSSIKKAIPEELKEALTKDFGSLDIFKERFKEASLDVFGSGWAWLIQEKSGKLAIVKTPNQENPLMDLSPVQGKPLLCCDVWEHAYYLKYENRRGDYFDAFWNLVDWDKVNALFLKKD